MFKKLTFLSLSLLAFLLTSCGLFYNVSINDEEQPNDYNVNLSTLEVSVSMLSPVFNQSVTNYHVEVTSDITSINIRAKASDGKSSVTIGGQSCNTDSARTVLLSSGINTVDIIVTAPDAVTKKTYNISINRHEPVLSNLTASAGNLSPAFIDDITLYRIFAYNIPSTTITPTIAKSGATVSVNGIAVISGQNSQPIALNPDGVNIITVRVTFQDLTFKDYIIKIYTLQPELVGNWPLNKDTELTDLKNGFNGYWMGTRSVDNPNPEYVQEADRSSTGLHFRYTANEYTESGSGDWIDCEKNILHSSLNINDYLTVSLWFFWDQDSIKFYNDGSSVPDEANTYMNIISKSVWFEYGWQIRYDRVSDTIELYLHHQNPSGYELIPIVKNLSEQRNRWVHLTVTIDNNNKEVFTYVNGIATSVSPQNYTTSFDPVPDDYSGNTWYTGHFAIGSFSHPWGGFSFNGKINDVRFYKGIITPAQAQELYNLK